MTTTPRSRAMDNQIEVTECLPSHPDASSLLDAFYQEQVKRYGFADSIEMSPPDYAAPNGLFIVTYLAAVAVGCGGYRWLDRSSRTIEIKKIYVTPTARGRGAGHAVMSWLEHHAIAAGACQVLLETGVRNTAALRLFTDAGYQPTDIYVENRDPAINRAFAKSLHDSADSPGADAHPATTR
jgi:GNAT superfamily N-acetyltransferase